MRSCPASGALVALLLLAGCAGGRDPAPAELEPFAFGTDAPAPLPDEADRTAARLASLALAGRIDDAAALMELAYAGSLENTWPLYSRQASRSSA